MEPIKAGLGVLALLALATDLVAGLWPFHVPANQVTWAGDGLRFGEYGVVFSSGLFAASAPADIQACSLELWLQASREEDSNTLLTFFTPAIPFRFSLHQSGSDLEIVREGAHRKHSHIYVDGFFSQKKLHLATLTSNSRITHVYVDGALVKTTAFEWTAEDLQGRLVIGTSPVVNDAWSGLLKGVAIYRTELTPGQVSRHYSNWMENGNPRVASNDRATAVYSFNEHRGNVVHNLGGSGPNLEVPARYTILHQRMLVPFWQEVFDGWAFVQNCLINIGGFVPLGFFVHAYFAAARGRRPIVAAILIGALTSFLIEFFQGFLPTRQSGTMDLITNTSGAAIGAILSNQKYVRAFFEHMTRKSASVPNLRQAVSR